MSATVLAGRYELRGLLGRGAMGEVHRAHDRELDRDVAVKFLSPDRRSETADTRLRDEARAGAAVSHPHAVAVYDVGRSARGVFVVMELVCGRNWAQDLRDRGPVPEREAARIGAALAAALAHAHARGVVHRDVCARNVMLRADDSPVLLDFGLARVHGVGGTEEPGHVLGTAATISPEQARGRPTDGRSDVFALGCTLHEALTGASPFPTAGPRRRVRPLRRLVPSLSARVEALVLRTLAEDPADRPDAADLARDLAVLAAPADPHGMAPDAVTGARRSRITGRRRP